MNIEDADEDDRVQGDYGMIEDGLGVGQKLEKWKWLGREGEGIVLEKSGGGSQGSPSGHQTLGEMVV